MRSSWALCALMIAFASHTYAQDAGVVDARDASTDAAEHARPQAELTTHPDFRVRLQAAELLGETRDATMRPVLERALSDGHPAVRAAVVTSLGKLGCNESLPVLRRLRTTDPSASVRSRCDHAIRTIGETQRSQPPAPAERPTSWQGVRYVVVVGDVQNRAQATDEGHYGETLRHVLEREVSRAPGFFMATSLNRALLAEASRRRLPVFRVDASINSVELRRQGTELYARTEIRLILLDGVANAMRGTVNGAASSTEPDQGTDGQKHRLIERTLGASVRSAMQQLPNALAPQRATAPAPRARRR